MAYPLTCQESQNSGSKNEVTGTSEAFEEDEIANEGDKGDMLIHES